ncbi:MAG: hypothetical protein ACQEXG_09965 [Pseudomonadota bacterium]
MLASVNGLLKYLPAGCLRSRVLHGVTAAIVMLLFGLAAMYAIHAFSLLAGLDQGPLAREAWPGWSTVIVSCGLVVVALQRYCFDRRSWLPILIVGVGLAVVLANVFMEFVAFTPYGDARYLPMVIERGEPFSRWLLGTAALSSTYPVMNMLLGIHPDEWVKVTGALVMAAFTAAIIINSRGRLAYLLPVMTPMWMVFSSGYDEYYPFIAGVYVYFVIALYHSRLPSGLWVPVLAAVMPLLYIAFAPLGALLLIRYWIDHPALRLKSLLVASLTYVLGISMLWPGGAVPYVAALYSDLNLGEVNTAYAPYQGESFSDYSPFFGFSYALSRQHFLELLYMLAAGAGVFVAMLTLVAAIWLAVVSRPFRWRRKLEPSSLIFAALVVWQLYYFVFMIPKLGPFLDIDLFFSFYLILAVVAGAMCDKCLSVLTEKSQQVVRYYLLSACAGAGFATCYLLLVIGVLPATPG